MTGRKRAVPTSSALGFALLALGVSGCGDRERPATSTPPPLAPGVSASAVENRTNGESQVPSDARPTRATSVAWRPLLDEISRAELDVDGALLDLGTAEQHKYTRGGFGTGWGPSIVRDGVSAGTAAGPRLAVDVVPRRPVAELVVRARSELSGQRLSARVDRRQLGEQALDREWRVLRFPVPGSRLPTGRLQLEFGLQRARPAEPAAHADGAGPAGESPPGPRPVAEFDWLWLAAEAGASPPALDERISPIRMGGRPRRALMASSARTYAFHLTPPEDAYLIFDHGSQVGATFTVSARVDGATEETLWSLVGDDQWREQVIDLGRFAGQATRLQLTTSGPAGLSGWAEPVIVRHTPARSRARDTSRPARNVIVIVIDTARADAFGPMAASQGSTDEPSTDESSTDEPSTGRRRRRPAPDRYVAPAVDTRAYDQWAAKSTIFVNAYNNANWTKPSVASTLSGVYPSTHDTKRQKSMLPMELQLLPQYLQRKGFVTGGFVANGYISRKFGFLKGWQTFRNYIRQELRSEAEYVYRDALSWLRERREQDRPFFLYVQTIDPHVEYKVGSSYWRPHFEGKYFGLLGPTIDASEQRMLSKSERGTSQRDVAWLRALYYGEISYHDQHMGEFLDAVAGQGLLEDTLLIITNDHGEELGERGHYGHGHSLHQEMIRAPLLVHYPPVFRPGARVPDIVEHVDVVPTILDVLGLPPMRHVEGQSLLPLVRGRPIARPTYAIAEFLDHRRALRVDHLSYRLDTGGSYQLFDLRSDPGERESLDRGHAISRRLCEIHIGEGLAIPDKNQRGVDRATRRRLVSPQLDLDPAQRRRFEALGYFGD